MLIPLIALIIFGCVVESKMLTVAGKLECCVSDKTPCPIYMQSTLVQLWEKNKLRPDKLLKGAMSDPKTGNFIISIPSDRVLSFEPYIKIEHKCNAKPGCKRLLIIDVPKVFVEKGWTFPITHLNLRKPFLGTTADVC